MRICLSCLKNTDNDSLYHKECVRRVFGSNAAPEIKYGLAELMEIAKTMSVSGFCRKLQMNLNKENNSLEYVSENGEYILKPQIQPFANLPENEQLCMSLCEVLNFNAAPHTLVKLQDDSYAYMVKRFDTEGGRKVCQEDFRQILAAGAQENGSYEEIGKAVKSVSSVPGLDLQLFYERVLFCFIIGNGRAGLKNFTMQYFGEGQNRLSPVYGMLSSKLANPDEFEETALTLNGKKNNITSSDFSVFAQTLNVLQAEKINKRIFGRINDAFTLIDNCGILSYDSRQKFKDIIYYRLGKLNF